MLKIFLWHLPGGGRVTHRLPLAQASSNVGTQQTDLYLKPSPNLSIQNPAMSSKLLQLYKKNQNDLNQEAIKPLMIKNMEQYLESQVTELAMWPSLTEKSWRWKWQTPWPRCNQRDAHLRRSTRTRKTKCGLDGPRGEKILKALVHYSERRDLPEDVSCHCKPRYPTIPSEIVLSYIRLNKRPVLKIFGVHM